MTECSRCKKQFDEEKYYEICPKCGLYNRKACNKEESAWQSFKGIHYYFYYPDCFADSVWNCGEFYVAAII